MPWFRRTPPEERPWRGEQAVDEARRAKRGFRISQVIMFVQAALSLWIGITLLFTMTDWLERGRAVPGSSWFAMVACLVLGVSTAIAAMALLTRWWARPLGTAVECVMCVVALINVITGFYQAVAGLALAIMVITLICTYEKDIPPRDFDTYVRKWWCADRAHRS
jgi:lysylphosphatidylglycerol synthetase-like protein (DUF2156 family)